MPLVPLYYVSDSRTEVKVVIRCPYCDIVEADIDLTVDTFRFACTPYLLEFRFDASSEIDFNSDTEFSAKCNNRNGIPVLEVTIPKTLSGKKQGNYLEMGTEADRQLEKTGRLFYNRLRLSDNDNDDRTMEDLNAWKALVYSTTDGSSGSDSESDNSSDSDSTTNSSSDTSSNSKRRHDVFYDHFSTVVSNDNEANIYSEEVFRHLFAHIFHKANPLASGGLTEQQYQDALPENLWNADENQTSKFKQVVSLLPYFPLEKKRVLRIQTEDADFDTQRYAGDFIGCPSEEHFLEIAAFSIQDTSLLATSSSASEAANDTLNIEVSPSILDSEADLTHIVYNYRTKPASGRILIEDLSVDKELAKDMVSLYDFTTEQSMRILLDVVYCFAHEHRMVCGDFGVESAKSISCLSAALSYMDHYGCINDTLYTVICTLVRRSLIYPLYRLMPLVEYVLSDVLLLFQGGKKVIQKVLVVLKTIYQKSEAYDLINTLYIDAMINWFQYLSEEDTFNHFVNELSTVIATFIEQDHRKDPYRIVRDHWIGLPLSMIERMTQGKLGEDLLLTSQRGQGDGEDEALGDVDIETSIRSEFIKSNEKLLSAEYHKWMVPMQYVNHLDSFEI